MSCNFKPCEKVTDKDVVGYYVPDNPSNKGNQYIRILGNYTYIVFYCSNDSIIKKQGTWDRYNGCDVFLNISEYNEIPGVTLYYGSFTWVRGKLSRGDYTGSFQKVRRKPKLVCEK